VIAEATTTTLLSYFNRNIKGGQEMSLYEQNEKGALVPVKGEIPEEALVAIERADEQTIVEKLTNVNAQQFFGYAYPIRTKEGEKWIIGIGVDGAKEIARQLGNINVNTELKVEEKGDHLYGVLPVTDLVRNVTLLGAARQSKYMIGEGMVPTDRIDDLAWVKLVNKCQRNGILAVADQLMLANIVSRLEPKAIKRLPLPPTYGKSTPAKPKEPVTEEEALKKLHQQVAIEAKKVFKTDEERKAWQKEQYNVDSMTELNEQQLKDMLAKIKELQQPVEPTLSDLGFSSEAEQKQARRELIKLLDEAGYQTQEQKKSWLQENKPREEVSKTSDLNKDEIEKLKEALRGHIKLIEEATKIDDRI
jgi:hypothetical protein